MKAAFAVEGQGAGTLYVESFHSILARTARLRRVNLHYLIRFLGATEAGGPDPKGVKTIGQIQGGCETTLRLLRQFARLDGSERCYGHTFAKVSENLGFHKLFPLRMRWCPACLDPDTGMGYFLLAHTLTDLVACPLHKCALRDRCPACGGQASTLLWSPDRSVCGKCGASLVQPCAGDHVSSDQLRADAQFYRLITYVTDSDQPAPPTDWRAQLNAGIQHLLAQHYDAYGPTETARMRVLSRARARFGWKSVVQLAQMQAVDVVDLLTAPTQALSPRLPGMSIHLNVHSRRRRVDRDLAVYFERTVEALLASPPKVALPSLKLLAIIVGVSYSFFWEHHRKLCAVYAEARQLRRVSNNTAREPRLPRPDEEISTADLLDRLHPGARALFMVHLGRYVGTDGRVDSYPDATLPRPVRWSTARKQLRASETRSTTASPDACDALHARGGQGDPGEIK
ncbi:TniQ family protein [Luteimonas deserti]|uniref:TniQ family protein n=1 Tax=Luteimonas deserti TaxID=2752306 RepID=A0A7Z0QNR7_9GAMM|nr:TniQ family protein [Luteimonas deserti]NYZ62006.1 TniQ family protein [Luteimonas deserti]